MRSAWKTLVKLYRTKFEITSKVLAIMCTRAVLLLCASGLSNETIATFLDIDKNVVDGYIYTTFKFRGWEKDLPYSPLYYYKTGKMCYTSKESEVCATFMRLFSRIEPFYK